MQGWRHGVLVHDDRRPTAKDPRREIERENKMLIARPVLLAMMVLLVSGCASYGVVQNAPGSGESGKESYSIRAFQEKPRVGDNSLMLAFSGGGTRAAALAYGVLKELRDTPVVTAGASARLLDNVNSISSVSGGSFTAAYYGLHGDGIFEDFEEVFLRQDVQGTLIRSVLNPLHWFSSTGRTELAVKYYEKSVFKGATFSDMLEQGGPMIVINASDLGYGVRFSFVQEYFNLLCSDLSSYPVASAVAASSAVPVLFNPVVVQNYANCGSELPDWLRAARSQSAENPEMALVVKGLESYFDRDKRRYAHFVDGGITDNLGLRAVYEVTEVSGGLKRYLKKYQIEPPRRLVLISVNASTDPEPVMDMTNEQPSLEETIGAMSDIQLHRYNVATIELMKQKLSRWAQDMSTPERPVEAYFILVDFKDIKDPKRRRFFNQTPTSFSLTNEQVDRLIEAGGELLRNNPEFRRLLSDMKNADQQNL
jgi:NTE family protein